MNIFRQEGMGKEGKTDERELTGGVRKELRAQDQIFFMQSIQDVEKKENREEKLQTIFKENFYFGKCWVKPSVSKKRKTYSVFDWRTQMLPVCPTSKCQFLPVLGCQKLVVLLPFSASPLSEVLPLEREEIAVQVKDVQKY